MPNLNIAGRLTIINDKTGGVIYTGENTVTDNGLAWVADQLSDKGENAISHMAVGTGTISDPTTATSIPSELARVAITSNVQSSNSIVVTANFGAGVGTGDLKSAGILNASSGGTLIACKSINISKGADDSYSIQWTITISRGT